MTLVDEALYGEVRPRLFAIAYRMLGSAAEAEDVVQEAFLRWQRAPEAEIRSARSYLAAVVTRLCVDHLRSSRVRREEYVGPWLPEPLVTEQAPGPAEELARADSLSTAFLVLLESLAPRERAAFLLREVFDYDYAEVARILETSEDNCRQMVHRARKRLAERRPRFAVAPEQHERLAAEFMRACSRGDMDGLLSLLAEDAVVYSDGGGKATAARQPVRGADRAARFLVGLLRKAPPDFALRPATVNGRTGFVGSIGEQPHNVVTLDVANGRVRGIYIVVNPDKLAALRR